MAESTTPRRQAMAFYRFVPVAQPAQVQARLLATGRQLDVKGTILVAGEGVNGTVVGPQDELTQLQAALVAEFGDIPFKFSDIDAGNQGFYRFKVKLKAEIVTFGVPDLDVGNTGEHVDAARWNELLADPNVLVIDTRNQYEIDIGTFPGAVSPQTDNFRQFPQWVEQNLDPAKQPQVAMFCTGGIRCEKASAYMREAGFAQVYQLQGGVLKYLEEADQQQNRWQGECFVFDQRVSVDARLGQGSYAQCYACRHPVTADEMAHPAYEKGVSCPHCIDTIDETARGNFRQRQRQVELARQRGQQHIGVQQGNDS